MSVVMVFEVPPKSLHKGTPMLLATASINAISSPALTFKHRHNFIRTEGHFKFILVDEGRNVYKH